jgi:preprotein translocase subunit SecG
MDLENYYNLAQLLISIVLIVVILLQSKGTDIGSAFGGGGPVGGGSSFRTRRGLEKTLFQLTIVLAVVFLLISALSVRYAVG